jgi:glycosyltransferase involved in cell wall biosynthesis
MIADMNLISCFRVAFLLDNLAGGGAEQVIINLAGEFARRGHPVDLLVCSMEGALQEKIPAGVNVIQLAPSPAVVGVLKSLFKDFASALPLIRSALNDRGLPKPYRWLGTLAVYLKQKQPAILLANLPKANVTAVLAARLAGVNTRVVVSVQNHLRAYDAQVEGRKAGRVRPLRPLMQYCYRLAGGVVAASEGVATDASTYLGIPMKHLTPIYNPVITAQVRELCNSRPGHPWFDDKSVPVLLAVGRLVGQKDFPLLLRAFAELRKRQPARLVILGGDSRSKSQLAHGDELLQLAEQLGVAEDFAMPGFQRNPYAWLNSSQVFVLSSRFEGFGNVVAEALFCGCQVVSTDCPSGPAEILAHGEFGRLVPLGDQAALSDALVQALAEPLDVEQGKQRAELFAVETVADRYGELFRQLLS